MDKKARKLTMTVTVPYDLLERLDAYVEADKQARSRSAIVSELLVSYFAALDAKEVEK